MLNTSLSGLGLSPEQTSLYLSLIENGPQSAIGLAKTTRIKRTYIYKLATELASNNLINIEKYGKTTFFIAKSPDILSSLAEEKLAKAKTAIISLESLLPTLRNQFNLSSTKPVIDYFEGVEGIKKVYLDLLKAKEPISAIVETSKLEPHLYEWLTTSFVKQRIKLQIPVRSIVASGPNTPLYTKLDKKEFRESKTINSTKFPFEHEIDIYGNKVAIINNKAGEKLVGIIINNATITTTFRSWFELTWSNLP